MIKSVVKYTWSANPLMNALDSIRVEASSREPWTYANIRIINLIDVVRSWAAEADAKESQSSELAIGDIVRLKSGGPKMTVAFINQDKCMCMCHWFDLNQAFCQCEFIYETLKLLVSVTLRDMSN